MDLDNRIVRMRGLRAFGGLRAGAVFGQCLGWGQLRELSLGKPLRALSLKRAGYWGESSGSWALVESLILAQDERWRRALPMQVGRRAEACSGRRLSNT